ncbi:hypothetical protein [Candidatus Poriferisocius sp.]
MVLRITARMHNRSRRLLRAKLEGDLKVGAKMRHRSRSWHSFMSS